MTTQTPSPQTAQKRCFYGTAVAFLLSFWGARPTKGSHRERTSAARNPEPSAILAYEGQKTTLQTIKITLLFAAIISTAQAQSYVDLATYTNSTTQVVNHACVLYNGTDLSCTESNPYITTAGLVGLGGITPTTALEVSGTISATAFVGNGSGLTGIPVSVTDGLSGSIVYRDQWGSLHAHPTFSISSTTGSVGIGAAAPSYIGNNGLYVTGQVRTTSLLTLGSDLYLGNNYSIFWNNGNSAQIKGNTDNSLAFTTNGTEALRIASTGNVGIGTSTPQSMLDVAGGVVIRGGTAYTLLNLAGSGNSDYTFQMTNGGSGKFKIVAKNTGVVNISNYATTNADTNIFSGNSGYIQIKSTGNVGISTSDPSATLHVSGTARLTSWTMVAANATPTTPLEVSGAIKISGDGTETCTGPSDKGKMRVNPTTGRIQICKN